MDSIRSSTPAGQVGKRASLGVRRVVAAGVVFVALAVLGAGVVMPLVVLTDRVVAAGVGAVVSVAAVFVTSGFLTLAAVLWEAPPGGAEDDEVRGPRVLPVRKKSGLTPDVTVRLLSALEPGARKAYLTKRVRSTAAPQRNTIYSSTPTRTYFVELRDLSGQMPDLYASLTKEGMHDVFDVPSRQRARETYAALAGKTGRVSESVLRPFADVTVVCGDREAALIHPSVPLAKLEHPDLREPWWATPGLLELFEGVPAVRLVDLLNEYAQPGVGARVNEGWAAAWVTGSEPRNRRAEQLGHALMHLTSLPEDYEFLYGRASEGKGSDPVLRTLRSETVARTASTRRDAAGIIAILATGAVAVLASRGAGPPHWAGDFWIAAVVQAGALVVAGIVVLLARPDHVSRQRRAGKQVIEMSEAREWRMRRSVPYVGQVFSWSPFSRVAGLSASPIGELVVPAASRRRHAGAELGAGAAYLYGDIGRWPRRRPFAARAVWVTVDGEFPRTDIVDRAMPGRVARTVQGEPFDIEHTEVNQRWRLLASDPHASQFAVGGRAAALLEELPPGEIAVHVVGNTVMVWDSAVAGEVDLVERHRWATRFAQALTR